MGIGSNVGRVVGRVLDNPILNGFFVAQSFGSMLSSGASAATNLAQDTTSLDQNTFQRAGYGIGSTIGDFADTVSAGAWFAHGLARRNPAFNDAFKMFNQRTQTTNMFIKQGEDMFRLESGALGGRVAAREAESIMERGTRGVISSGGKFLKNAGWKFTAATMAVPLAAHMLLTPAIGFAGKMLDEVYNQSRQARRVQYDDRYIVNQQQDMSTYQQVGAAMDAYQNRMMSMGRIYHSR